MSHRILAPSLVWDAFWSPAATIPGWDPKMSLGEMLLLSKSSESVYAVTLAGCVASTLGVEAPVMLDEPALWVWTRDLSALDVISMDAQGRSALTADFWSSSMALGPLGFAQTVHISPPKTEGSHSPNGTRDALHPHATEDLSEEDHIAANRFLMGFYFWTGLAPTQGIILQGFRGTSPLV
jgi:hypothetical protein